MCWLKIGEVRKYSFPCGQVAMGAGLFLVLADVAIFKLMIFDASLVIMLPSDVNIAGSGSLTWVTTTKYWLVAKSRIIESKNTGLGGYKYCKRSSNL